MNTFVPIVGGVLLPTNIDVKPLQFWKALLPIDITLSGIINVVIPLQFVNALAPILVSVLGKSTLLILVHPLKVP